MISKSANSNVLVKQTTDQDIKYGPALKNRVVGFYDVVVGSAAQVTNGSADYSTIQAGITACPAGGSMLILGNTYTETVTLSKGIEIFGKGYTTVLNGTFTMASGAIGCVIQGIKFTGNVTIASGANENFLVFCWLGSTYTLTDSGSSNVHQVIGE